MKKLLLTAFMAVSLIVSAFAGPAKRVNSFVANSFASDFKNVSNADWSINSSYAKATFVLNNVKTEAFYRPDGEFIGSSQAIAINDLPIAAKRSFAKKYGNYVVKEAIKFDGKEENAFFISAENEKQSVILKADNFGISVYSVSSKN